MNEQNLYLYKAFVERVVDGDTAILMIDMGFEIYVRHSIRVYGFDAAETRTKNLIEKAHGMQSKVWLKDRIEGKYIIFESIRGRAGKYGRYLGTFYDDIETAKAGKSITKEMIDLGFQKRALYE